MVRLFRGPAMPIRGRGAIRPHFMNQRQMGPLRFDPRYVNPVNGGRIIRGHHPVGLSSGPSRPPLQLPSRGTRLLRPPPMGSPRLLPPRGAPRLLPPRTPLPPRPFYPTDIRPPMHIAGRPRLPPLRHLSPRHMLPVPPSGPPIAEHHMFPPVGLLRGRGGRGRVLNRGIGLKRLGSRPTANGLVNRKKTQKHKERTEEMELSKPWVTEALKLEIQKKFELYKIAKEKENDGDWQIYKDQRILVGKMTNVAKLEYIGSNPDVDVDQIMFGVTAKG